MIRLSQKNFDQFLLNQEKFADSLNHRMTKIEVNVIWIKRLLFTIVGIMSAMFIATLARGL